MIKEFNINSDTFNDDVSEEVNKILNEAAINKARQLDINYLKALNNLSTRKKRKITKWIVKEIRRGSRK